MRGEKIQKVRIRLTSLGSSPHARGKAFLVDSCAILLRIIPACAGKSQRTCASSSGVQDHPRMRGEKFVQQEQQADHTGSSPHARGKAYGE